MARGYQKGAPNAFWRYINNCDGLPITQGNPHQHNNYGHLLLVYINDGPSRASHSACPCAPVSGAAPDSFVGDNYYCESGKNV